MPNQALAYHRVSPRVFDLTSLRTGNVRDQLLRATLLAQGLLDEGILSSASKLLVLGGGAAGMTVAMTAAEGGVNVTVIEKDAAPFSTLLQASFRRVDPTEYDWPHAHWTKGVFPFGMRSAVLPQTVGPGSALANSFMKEFQDWTAHRAGQMGRGKVTVRPPENADPFFAGITDLSPKAGVDVSGPWKSATDTTERFAVVVRCYGFGDELTSDFPPPGSWGGFSGHRFWFDNDNLSDGHLPLPKVLNGVLISGGGDGAMQDVQRALTGWFGKELFEKLETRGRELSPTFDLQPEWLRADILAAEDKARRAHAWKSNKGVPGELEAWHKAIEAAVSKLVASWKMSHSNLHALLRAVFRPEVMAKRLHVTWVVKEATPGYAYALNRFLVLLLEELVTASRTVTGWHIHRGYEITSIRPPNGHKCSTPGACFGYSHTVHLKAAFPSMSPVAPKTAELILIRHGISPSAARGRAPVPEQMVPFDLPS
ncbi:FAD-binding protein [Variovorax sp. J22R24]|uniref:FAD-binding protein n=1 Tax=Variovorax gracilis TaxID=3053502 RepID=UPI00257557FF|nr:FAD-binding protein [Variovorax sp. J22R24]MDM0108652.1 FAD-binding protein [Variovorax sp. J22R24]